MEFFSLSSPIRVYRKDIKGRIKNSGPNDWYKELIGKEFEMTFTECGYWINRTKENEKEMGRLYQQMSKFARIREKHVDIILY